MVHISVTESHCFAGRRPTLVLINFQLSQLWQLLEIRTGSSIFSRRRSLIYILLLLAANPKNLPIINSSLRAAEPQRRILHPKSRIMAREQLQFWTELDSYLPQDMGPTSRRLIFINLTVRLCVCVGVYGNFRVLPSDFKCQPDTIPFPQLSGDGHGGGGIWEWIFDWSVNWWVRSVISNESCSRLGSGTGLAVLRRAVIEFSAKFDFDDLSLGCR